MTTNLKKIDTSELLAELHKRSSTILENDSEAISLRNVNRAQVEKAHEEIIIRVAKGIGVRVQPHFDYDDGTLCDVETTGLEIDAKQNERAFLLLDRDYYSTLEVSDLKKAYPQIKLIEKRLQSCIKKTGEKAKKISDRLDINQKTVMKFMFD